MSTHDLKPMPVRATRKFKGNAISMTGRVSGQQLESSLERDFLTLVRFDSTVDRFVTQPISLVYSDVAGQTWPYTPDCLVIYKQTSDRAGDRPPLLCEIKYEKELEEDRERLEPKFAAARAYCNERGWRFGVFSEKQIRTPLLDNARFLLPYRNRKLPKLLTDPVKHWFQNEGPATPQTFLASIDNGDRLNSLAALWHLVATGSLGCDLSQAKISNHTQLWHISSETA